MNCSGCRSVAIIDGSAHCAAPSCPRHIEHMDEAKQHLFEAQAQIAMQQEALETCVITENFHYAFDADKVDDAISATSETVAAWRAKEFGECTRSHPHELMSPMCKLRTEIARLTNHLATAQAEAEPLRRDVAMLINLLHFVKGEFGSISLAQARDIDGVVAVANKSYELIKEQIADIQATALAYEREVKAKALEGLHNVLIAVFREIEFNDDYNDGNAPGHAHDTPGIWDDDNGNLSGTECAWCKLWNTAKAMLSTAPQPGGSNE